MKHIDDLILSTEERVQPYKTKDTLKCSAFVRKDFISSPDSPDNFLKLTRIGMATQHRLPIEFQIVKSRSYKQAIAFSK